MPDVPEKERKRASRKTSYAVVAREAKKAGATSFVYEEPGRKIETRFVESHSEKHADNEVENWIRKNQCALKPRD